jgi:hypothetical protein
MIFIKALFTFPDGHKCSEKIDVFVDPLRSGFALRQDVLKVFRQTFRKLQGNWA